jgi:hypothetical protein
MRKLAEQQSAREDEQASEVPLQGARSRTDSMEDDGSTNADGSPSAAKAEDANGLRPSLRASLCAAKLLTAIGGEKGMRRVTTERRPSDPGQSAFAQQIELAKGSFRRQSSFGSGSSGNDSRRPSNAGGGPSRARKPPSAEDVLAQLQRSKGPSKEEEEDSQQTCQPSHGPCPTDAVAIAAAAVAEVESAKKRPSMTSLVRNLGSSTRIAPSPMRAPATPEPSLCDRVRRHSVC